MDGNYEFVNHMAKDKQRMFIREARERRAAKQAGSQGGAWSTRAYVAHTGAWLLQAANRAAGQVVDWRPTLRQPSTSPH
jgi:hypothetical protein